MTMARAMATRCCCPPDSWVGQVIGPVGQPDRGQRLGRSPRRSAVPHPGVGQRQGHVAVAVVRGIRLKFWKTNPILRLRIVASWYSSSVRTSTPSSR